MGETQRLLVFNKELLVSIVWRLEIWRDLLTGFFIQPLKGFGLGVRPFTAPMPLNVDTAVYSSFVQFIVVAGVLGVVWLGYVLYKLPRRLTTESIAILSIIVLCCVEAPFEIPRLWLTLMAVTAFYVIKEIDYGRTS